MKNAIRYPLSAIRYPLSAIRYLMYQKARENYIQGDVFTATPQKLQLLLIEAAMKNIHRTKQAWLDERFDDGFDSLSRAQDIVAEILCSLDVEGNPAIAKKLASIYIFIFRRLAEGGMEHSQEKLDDALRILSSERETWKLVCDKFGSTIEQAPTMVGENAAATYTPSQQPAKILVSGGTTPKPLGTTPLSVPDNTPTIPKPPVKPTVPPKTGNNWEA